LSELATNAAKRILEKGGEKVVFAGDAFRGATWVSLHNGGGVGWGEVVNGGFGLVS
jgi:hypothetical protein